MINVKSVKNDDKETSDEALYRKKSLEQLTKQRSYIFDGVLDDSLYDFVESLNFSIKEWEKFKKRLITLHSKIGINVSSVVIDKLNQEINKINKAKKQLLIVKNLLEEK